MKTLHEVERETILNRLHFFDGNKKRTAKSLDVTIGTIRNKLHAYGIPIEEKLLKSYLSSLSDMAIDV